MHVVLPWSWPSHGLYLYQGLPAVGWILHESGYPLLVLELMPLKPLLFSLGYCPEPSRPEASLRRLSLAMPYPGDALTWQRLSKATPRPGDASVGQSVDFLPWIPRGVLPHVDFDLRSTPGDGMVHKPPSLELTLVSAKRLRPRPIVTCHFDNMSFSAPLT